MMSLLRAHRRVMLCCECRHPQEAARGSILFSILNGAAAHRHGHPETHTAHRHGHLETHSAHRHGHLETHTAHRHGHLETHTAHRLCSCAPRRKLVAARAPHLVFKAASDVLVKTFRFVKNVPCFRGLPAEDQRRLVRHSWAPLLVLGMVQDSVDFDTVETQQPSLLHMILTHSKERRRAETDPGVPVGDAQGIQMFLVRCRELRITVKEYAFLKGAILFSPEVSELECREYVHALHREAEHALYEHVTHVQRGKPGRFGRMRAVLSALRSVDAQAVAGLFFRPVTGARSADEHVLALFNER